MTVEAEYDHLHRCPDRRRHDRHKECIVCGEHNPIEKWEFSVKIIRLDSFTYNLFCPECDDRTIHSDPTSLLVTKISVRK